MNAVLTEVLDRAQARWAPPPDLTVSEFADQEIVVTSGPLSGTRWQTDFAPYQRGILDAIHEPGVQFVVIMGSSQWGKTACAVNVVCYHIGHDPCEILVVEPSEKPMAEDFAKNRLDPTIKASPLLSGLVDKKRAKDASNTTLLKTFRGGFVALAGANSAASLAARSIRLLVLDEVDRYERELKGEGATISVAIKRTTTFRSRRRVLLLSSPTLVGGPIHSWYVRGDQRRYHVPCPSCGTMHPYEWQQVRWDPATNDPRSARLHCPACDHAIDEAERVAILSKGRWVSEVPDAERSDPSIVSFHIWEAYSPLSSLSEVVKGFLSARAAQKAGDRAEMHTWQNTTLGEPVEPDDGEGVESAVLLARREPPVAGVEVPAGACLLTMGVDTQDDRLEALVVGWGPGEESWLVDRVLLPGATDQPQPWQALDELLQREYQHAVGVKLPIAGVCIDSAGHRTDMVYEWAGKWAARRVFATIGRDGQRPLVGPPSKTKYGKRKVGLYVLGVDAAKALIVSRLGLSEAGPGFVHIPVEEWADEELVAQLTSERLVKRWHKGVMRTEWRKTRPRNEMLDCAVMALGALRLLHPDLPAILRRLEENKPQPPASPSTARPRWIAPRPNWLRGRR